MIAGLAAGLSVVGTVASTVGGLIGVAGQQKAEKMRELQMNLEAKRARREQVRKAQTAAATATATAWNQGAGTSSALAGGQAQINNQAGRNIAAISTDQAIGQKIFDANRQTAQGQTMQVLGGGVSSLGGAIGSSAGVLTRLGESFKPAFNRGNA